jgi:broad specificity phosphatase PhoE
MSRRIYFITHPDVVIDPALPVPQWPLSERGRHRIRHLLSQDWLPQVDAIYCSTEQKAIDGASILSQATGIPFHQVAALGENDRSATGYLPSAEFETIVEAFFARPRESVWGWERADAAQARIVEALGHIACTASGSEAIAVVSHGGVGALLLCHLKGQPISRQEEQPGTSGGNYFLFQMPEGTLVHGWRPIDA